MASGPRVRYSITIWVWNWKNTNLFNKLPNCMWLYSNIKPGVFVPQLYAILQHTEIIKLRFLCTCYSYLKATPILQGYQKLYLTTCLKKFFDYYHHLIDQYNKLLPWIVSKSVGLYACNCFVFSFIQDNMTGVTSATGYVHSSAEPDFTF